MSLLKKSASSLANESTSILEVFSKTLDKLSNLNERISAREDKIQVEIDERERDLATLEKAREANQRVIGKIQELIK